MGTRAAMLGGVVVIFKIRVICDGRVVGDVCHQVRRCCEADLLHWGFVRVLDIWDECDELRVRGPVDVFFCFVGDDGDLWMVSMVDWRLLGLGSVVRTSSAKRTRRTRCSLPVRDSFEVVS